MARHKKNYYEILGVTKEASLTEIKRAYRKLAMDHHPDRNPNNKESEEKFKEASVAYQVLSDPQKRQQYDQYGEVGGGFSGGQPFSNFEDIFSAFSDIFGSGAGGYSSKGDDLQVSLSITFLEAAQGGEKELEYEKPVVCGTCSGNGAKPGSKPLICGACQGTGQVAHRQGFFTIATPCGKCQGQGTLITSPCLVCKGSGQDSKTEKVKIRIPAGVDDGTRLRLSGFGASNQTGGGAPGDLYVVFRVAKDKNFSREGENLVVEVPLSVTEAILGAKIEILTLEGNESIEVSPGTQSYEEKVIPNRGIPHLQGRGRGNLIIRFYVQIPDKSLPDEALSLVLQLNEYLKNPRGEKSEKQSFAKETEEEGSVFSKIFHRKKKPK